MKTFKSIQFLVILLMVSTVFTSCSKDDDNGPTGPTPSVSYTETNLEAYFFQPGNSEAANVDWNGSQGGFSLATPVTGLSINSTTGMLSWTSDLPLGTHNLQIIASNGNGQTSVMITLNNPLQGVFIGNYDTSEYFRIDFQSDGTATIYANSSSSPDIGIGSWTRTGNRVYIEYVFNNGASSTYSLLGNLNIGTNVIFSGDWYFLADAIPGNEVASFEMEIAF